MSKQTSWYRRPRVLWVALPVAAALTLAGVVLAGSSSPSAPPWSPPDPTDTAAMTKTIEAKWTSFHQVLPLADGLANRVPADVAVKAKERFFAGLEAVGTEEYISLQREMNPDFGASLRGDLDRGYIVTKLETKVLGLEYKGTLPNGDVVVWASTWHGEIDLQFDRKIGNGPATTRRIDDTPTWQYVMRKVDGKWRIVSETQVYISEDNSPEYGPNTPHLNGPKALVAVPAGASTPLTPAPSASATSAAD